MPPPAADSYLRTSIVYSRGDGRASAAAVLFDGDAMH